jgi:hypothetical protein
MAKRGRQKGMRVEPAVGSWTVIERQFVQGLPQTDGSIYYPTLVEIRDAHRVSYSTLRRRMYEGNWMRKREQFQENLSKWLHVASYDDYVEAARKFDAICIEVSQKAMENILGYIDEAKANGKLLDQIALDRLGRSAMAFQKVGRLALGLSTENNATRQEEVTTITQVDSKLLTDREQMILNDIASEIERRKNIVVIQEPQ